MPRPPGKRKTKGDAVVRQTAHGLFGLPNERGNVRVKETAEDREHMAIVLSRSSDPRMRELARDATLDVFTNTSFAKLAEQHGLNYHMIASEYKELRKSEGFIRAAQHIPDIMEQTALRAKEQVADCPVCKGMGKVDGKGGVADCKECKGTGNIITKADENSLALIFNTFGLTGKGGGVNVNLDLSRHGTHESLGDLAGTLDGIITGSK